MKYTSVFRMAGSLNAFIKDTMVDMGHRPAKAAIEIMLWRLSNTSVGSEMIARYVAALSNPDLWRDTMASFLHSLSKIMNTVQLCARSDNYGTIEATINNNRERVRLRDLITQAQTVCSSHGYKTKNLFEYIEECRNIFTHAGIMPYWISTEESKSFDLNDFLRHRFKDDLLAMAAVQVGAAMFQSKGDNDKYRALCNLVMAALCFYFDSLNPNLSKYAIWRHTTLLLTMVGHAIKTFLMYVFGFIFITVASGVELIRGLFAIAVVGLIVVIISVVAYKSIGFFNGSNDTYELTDIEPTQLSAWVEEMTPYEQMSFLESRQSSLASCELYHKVGEAATSPSDSATDRLYTEFKNCPDPKAHPYSLFPNAEKLSRVPIIGWPLSQQWLGEKQFTSLRKGLKHHTVDYLPVYQGDFYPLWSISGRYSDTRYSRKIVENLASYPKLNILLMYGSGGFDERSEKFNLELAQQLKKELSKLGISSRRISIMADPTNRSGVTLCVGNLPTQH